MIVSEIWPKIYCKSFILAMHAILSDALHIWPVPWVHLFWDIRLFKGSATSRWLLREFSSLWRRASLHTFPNVHCLKGYSNVIKWCQIIRIGLWPPEILRMKGPEHWLWYNVSPTSFPYTLPFLATGCAGICSMAPFTWKTAPRPIHSEDCWGSQRSDAHWSQSDGIS